MRFLRWLFSPKGRLFLGLICLSVFIYTKVNIGDVINDGVGNYFDNTQQEKLSNHFVISQLELKMAPRSHCQIIYILGVEGSIHHGFTPVLHSLALKQTDPNNAIDVQLQPNALRAALFGRFREKRPLNDQSLVHDTLRKLCPNDGVKHIVIEDSSFPCGQEGDPRGYRYPRQHAWLNMTMAEIASSEIAMEHPVNLFKFVQLYRDYADIKFIVLHRPFLETIASHMDWDESIQRHSNVIRGFMLILRRFLDAHAVDSNGEKYWTIVCVERLMSQYYRLQSEQGREVIDHDAWNKARRNIVFYLTDFLGWSQRECTDCFNSWRDSSKSKIKTIKDDELMPLLDHMKEVEGIWPPMLGNGLKEQQCST
jgi:hypothetical protein